MLLQNAAVCVQTLREVLLVDAADMLSAVGEAEAVSDALDLGIV